MSDDKKSNRLSEALESILEQGETVTWKGEPAKIRLLAAPQGAMIILRWAVCFLLLLFVLWFALIYNSDVSATTNVRVTVVLAIIILAYISIRPITDIFTIQRYAVFCITNTRAIVFLLKSQIQVKHAIYKDISKFDIDMISSNCGNVYIGSKAHNSLRKSRGDTLTFPDEGNQPERPLVFYNVENPDKIVSFFK